jgi:FKBP-type peptidyl-prolyl cis-trans isomerase FkpA
MMNFIYKFFVLFILASSFSACNKENFESQIEEINAYIKANNLTVDTIYSESVFVVVDRPGGDDKPVLSSVVETHYKGYYTDNVVFDSSYDRGQTLKAPLNGLIKGWQIGMRRFGKDGKGKILMTSDNGYGANPTNGIRKSAVLIFDIEMIDF